MKRKEFIQKSSLFAGGVIITRNMSNPLSQLTEKTEKMPVLFMGHGSPMNAIEDNPFTQGWAQITRDIPKPKAILVISAHWETNGTLIFAGDKPEMIYDMYGFPRELYKVDYPAPGAPELATEIAGKVNSGGITPTHEWGLDHGAWSVLVKMFPEADIPCFQLSINRTRNMEWHYNLGKQLAFLRERGVLVVGSGNIVHNLRYLSSMNAPAAGWALEFDHFAGKMIDDQNHGALIYYQKFGEAAMISVNSAEHYIPLLYALALQEKNEPVLQFNHGIGSSLLDVFMRCVKIG